MRLDLRRQDVEIGQGRTVVPEPGRDPLVEGGVDEFVEDMARAGVDPVGQHGIDEAQQLLLRPDHIGRRRDRPVLDLAEFGDDPGELTDSTGIRAADTLYYSYRA